MKKILILSASYGEGHNAAARGLREAFERTGCVSAEIFDVFAEAYGDLYNRTRTEYLQLIDNKPKVWAALYGMLDRTPLIHAITPALRKAEQLLYSHLQEHQPAAVVSTYPIYNYLLNRLAARGAQPFRQYTVVTDSITVNSVWFRCDTDAFFVPNEDTAVAMKRAGVSTDKLRVTGFPVLPVFALDRPERSPVQADAPFRVLYMINAGKSEAPANVAELLQVPGVALTVTVGRDEALKERIEVVANRARKNVEIHGWTPRMPELLMTNHVLIGKAGGAAVQEAVAARTPMIITQVVPGQEEGNARLLLERECGCLAETPGAIATAVRQAMADNGRRWAEWERNIGAISRPDAAIRIVESVLAETGGIAAGVR